MTTKNLTIRGMVDRLLIFMHEVVNSVSAKVGSYRQPDIDRLKEYLFDLKTFKDQAMAKDPADLPHWHSRDMELPDFPVVSWGENPAVNDIKLIFEALYVEMVKCQSKDLPMGFLPADSARIDALIAHCEEFIENYVEVSMPLDNPESAASQN